MHAQDLTEDEEAEAVDEDIVDDVTTEDEDDEAEVEDDENTELVSGRMGLKTSFNKAIHPTKMLLVCHHHPIVLSCERYISVD